MGPFPHNSPRAEISASNPAGTDGFEFVEFSHPDPEVLRSLFSNMGYAHVANHKNKPVELWQQGDISYLINADPAGFAAQFATEHGPCASAMAWRVADAQLAFKYAVDNGAEPFTSAADKTVDWPAIKGIGGSLISVSYTHLTLPTKA